MAGLLGQWLARLGEDVAGVSDALFGDRVERQLDQEIRGIDDALHRVRADIASTKASRIVATQREQALRKQIAESTAQAEQAWTMIAQQFGDLMAGKGMVIQTAESGGRNFFRLRATGFPTEQDSRRFCAALEAENVKCIPVAHR